MADLDSQLAHEQFPSECRKCKTCRLVAYHRDRYVPAALGRHDSCWTCKIQGESAHLKRYGGAGVGER